MNQHDRFENLISCLCRSPSWLIRIIVFLQEKRPSWVQCHTSYISPILVNLQYLPSRPKNNRSTNTEQFLQIFLMHEFISHINARYLHHWCATNSIQNVILYLASLSTTQLLSLQLKLAGHFTHILMNKLCALVQASAVLSASTSYIFDLFKRWARQERDEHETDFWNAAW